MEAAEGRWRGLQGGVRGSDGGDGGVLFAICVSLRGFGGEMEYTGCGVWVETDAEAALASRSSVLVILASW
jgi:hypothetical protein